MGGMGIMNSSPHSIDMAFHQGHAGGSTGSGPTPPFFANAPQQQQPNRQQQGQQQHFMQQQQQDTSPANHVRFSSKPDVHWHPMAHSDSTSPFGMGLDPGLMASGAGGGMQIQASNQGGQSGQGGLTTRMDGTGDWTTMQRSGSASGFGDTLRSTQQNEQDGREQEHGGYSSIPPTRSGSLTPDDLLAPEDIINPLGAMSSMAGLVEAAVKASRSSGNSSAGNNGASTAAQSSAGAGSGGYKREADATGEGEDDQGFARPAKRGRSSPTVPSGPVIQEVQHLPPQSSKEKGKRERKKTHIHAYPDIVAEGLISEEEGQELMAM